MADPPKTRIPPPPLEKVYNTLIFGDFSIARLVSPFRVEDTNQMKFFFIPTIEMKFKFQIQDYEYNRDTGVIEKEFPKDKCFWVSDYPLTWIVLCDYKLQNVDNTFVRMINSTLLEQNKRYNQEISNLKSLLAKLSYDFQMILKHPEAIQLKTVEWLEKVKKVVGTTTEVITPEGMEQSSGEMR